MVRRDFLNTSGETRKIGSHTNGVIRAFLAERFVNAVFGFVETVIEDERVRSVHEHDVIDGHFLLFFLKTLEFCWKNIFKKVSINFCC